MQVTNYPYECAVRIVIEESDYTLGMGDVSKIQITKWEWSSSGMNRGVMFTKEFEAGSKPIITLLDRNVAASNTYRYQVEYYTNGWKMGESNKTVTPSFRHSVIEDDNQVFYLVGNPSVEYTRENSVTFVQPFYSRFPVAVVQGEMCYNKGSCSAIFAPFDNNGEPDWRGNAYYRRMVLDFLSNPTVKRLRTVDGLAMQIFVDSSIAQTNTGFTDGEEVEFAWEQVGDLDLTAPPIEEGLDDEGD